MTGARTVEHYERLARDAEAERGVTGRLVPGTCPPARAAGRSLDEPRMCAACGVLLVLGPRGTLCVRCKRGEE